MNMSWEVRKHYDKETREKLQSAISDADLRAEVEKAYNDSVAAIERAESQMQNDYARIPGLLADTSAVSGVSQIQLLTVARRIAVGMRDMEWHQVLSIINGYYRVQKAIENEDKS